MDWKDCPAMSSNATRRLRPGKYYKGFAATLADRGYIVFAPHNPYRGGNAFRDLQRKANPLGRSLFSIIAASTKRSSISLWRNRSSIWRRSGSTDCPTAASADAASDPGTALRAIDLFRRLQRMGRSNSTVDWRGSYVYAPEHEIFEWDLGHTFNDAEMAALIALRPFMVERGHRDGVGLDEWVAFEYAKVRRYYADLKIPERTEIEWFDGPHTINGVGTFAFLERRLGRAGEAGDDSSSKGFNASKPAQPRSKMAPDPSAPASHTASPGIAQAQGRASRPAPHLLPRPHRDDLCSKPP